jgi:hypothetical protein
VKGRRPLRAEGIAGFAFSPAGVSPSFPRIASGVQDGSLGRPDGWVIPLPPAALPLSTPGLVDGQGCSAALHPEGEEESRVRTEDSPTSTAGVFSGASRFRV